MPQDKADLILALTAPMSARPASLGFKIPITLPISLILTSARDSPIALLQIKLSISAITQVLPVSTHR